MKKNLGKTLAAALLITGGGLGLSACNHDSDVVSKNLSKAADSFQIQRRIVFYNGITGQYILEVQGLCALGNDDGPSDLTVICKTGPHTYKKHFLGLSDNVTYFAEQIGGARASTQRYKVIFKPSVIIPDVDAR